MMMMMVHILQMRKFKLLGIPQIVSNQAKIQVRFDSSASDSEVQAIL